MGRNVFLQAKNKTKINAFSLYSQNFAQYQLIIIHHMSASLNGQNSLYTKCNQILGFCVHLMRVSSLWQKNNEHKACWGMFSLWLCSVFLQVLQPAVLWLGETCSAPANPDTQERSAKGGCCPSLTSPPHHPSCRWGWALQAGCCRLQGCGLCPVSSEMGWGCWLHWGWKNIAWGKYKIAHLINH